MATFSKRHYEAIAQVMQTAHPGEGEDEWKLGMNRQWSETCKDFAEMFERDSSAFDIVRFMRACKPGASAGSRRAA